MLWVYQGRKGYVASKAPMELLAQLDPPGLWASPGLAVSVASLASPARPDPKAFLELSALLDLKATPAPKE